MGNRRAFLRISALGLGGAMLKAALPPSAKATPQPGEPGFCWFDTSFDPTSPHWEYVTPEEIWEQDMELTGWTTTQVNFRGGPGTRFPVIEVLEAGIKVTLRGYAMGTDCDFYKFWFRVELSNGFVGWIRNDYIRGKGVSLHRGFFLW